MLYENFTNYRRFVSYYPSMNFTCSGNITKILFVTNVLGLNPPITLIPDPMARFGARSTSELESLLNNSNRLQRVLFNMSLLRAEIGPGAQDDDVDVREVNKTNRYSLYELTLNGRARISFNTRDVLVIHLTALTLINPLHQDGGGWNEYISYNYTFMPRGIHSTNILIGTFLPLVAIEAGKYLIIKKLI